MIKTVSPMNAATALGIGKTKLYQILNEGKIRSFLLGRRRLILVEDIDAFVRVYLQQEEI